MYVDGFLLPVKRADRQVIQNSLAHMQGAFMDAGANRCVDCWGTDVPDGERTSFPMAVDLQDGEVVIFGWIEWPDKEARDTGMEAAMKDPRMDAMRNAAFDSPRMVFGGFTPIVESARE